MKAAVFLTQLDMEEVTDAHGVPMTNRDGRQLFRLLSPLIFFSIIAAQTITVPAGFITDLASIPRWPVVYWLLNGVGDRPAVVHDWLYSTGQLARVMADDVLREACQVTGVRPWKIELVYEGVRLFGASHFKQAQPA